MVLTSVVGIDILLHVIFAVGNDLVVDERRAFHLKMVVRDKSRIRENDAINEL
jgi:hypothetical protein